MRNSSSLPLVFTGFGLIFCTPLAVAQTGTDADFNLRPLIVTTTLATETADESLSSVTVIDREAIERQQPREFSSLLQGQPGVNVVSNGGFGKNTSVFTRGTGSESTVLLIDGIRIRSATTGGAPWQHVPAQLLNRVEIVRGPRGSLYGADAVGGVIQGFTLPQDDNDRAWVEVGGGNFSTQQTGAGVSGREGNTRYSLQGNYFETDGTRIREGGDDKGYRNASGSASIRHELGNDASLGLLAFRSQGNTEFDSGDTDFVLQTLGVNGDIRVTENWKTGVTLSESRDEGENNAEGGGVTFFDTRTRLARWENTFLWGRQQLVAGAEYLVDEVDSTTEYDEDSRDNKAVFGQFIVDRNEASLQLSARWDDNEAFGDRATGAVAVGFELTPSHRARLSYGTAFRAPSFNDLYFPNFGNPDLSPETSSTAEFGIRGQYRSGFWDLAVYKTDVDDLILLAENIARAQIRGVELSSGLDWQRLELRSALTLQDPRDKESNNRLARRTHQSLRVDADYLLDRVNFGVSVIAEGYRYNDTDNEERISGFTTADLRMGVQLAQNLRLRLSLENVFDRQYNTVRAIPFNADDFDYLAAGRTVFASLRYEVF
ncbi:MAG: TonB-dependent receptor [Halomonadaceae bacterium]|nr:MAG: TonB-dependent receptor [Halomonadaceae bacterium]